MDAVYRAAEAAAPGGQSSRPRVVLDAKARRQRDKDSVRRARRKSYEAGLTSTTLDEFWREATKAPPDAPSHTSSHSNPSSAAARVAVDVDVMTGGQAFSFFSRCELPRGELQQTKLSKHNGCPSVSLFCV